MSRFPITALYLSGSISAAMFTASAPIVLAQSSAEMALALPTQPLGASVRELALRSGRTILVDTDLIAGKTGPALHGAFTVEQALDRLLAGSGLHWIRVEGGIVIQRSSRDPRPMDELEPAGIVVTGSRIRGAPIASPTIRLDREAMLRSGQTSMTDVVRSVPQNYNGGLNTGVGANAGANNIDMGGATTINLRGLGSDATLTLLNGHRLAYSGSRQGVDVSAIPVGAVDRLEIVADGASAIYGSDAVAGVANIILRRDFEGLKFEAEGGLATEGGFSRQRAGVTTGACWQSGGIIASYEYARNSALTSDERSFADGRPGVTIFPPLERHAILLSGHQSLTDRLILSADLLFNRRKTEVIFPANPAGDRTISSNEQPTTSRSFAFAPALNYDLGSGWTAQLSGVYGREKLVTRVRSYLGTTRVGSARLCYCNDGQSAELGADGPVFRLPAGPVKMATGVGYRRNLLDADRGPGNPGNVRQAQESVYAYGELSLPLVSPDMDMTAVHRLSLSGALRYERYPGVGEVVTPKLGLIYAPLPDFDIKASWGRSFRAPTLFQQYQVPGVYLYPAASLGGTGAPAGATALLVVGGNPGLKPERARTWTATIDIHPVALEGFRLQLSYFDTDYTDRIVTPITFTSQSLSNSAYAGFVTRDPGASAAQAVIASALQFLNVTGRPVDASSVVAIIDNRNRNAGRQAIRGVDILADYRFALGGGETRLTANMSYLHAEQQLSRGQPILPLSGLLFTPPHWRGRAGASWSGGGLSLNGTVNYIGGVIDRRTATPVRVRGMTTVDGTMAYRFTQASVLAGVELSLSVLNAFDSRPQEITSTSYVDSTYDSTNYSPLGRMISLRIAKSW